MVEISYWQLAVLVFGLGLLFIYIVRRELRMFSEEISEHLFDKDDLYMQLFQLLGFKVSEQDGIRTITLPKKDE